jgi:O-antigen ligase
MLVFIFFTILLLAPVLQGVWDFRTQFVFEAAVFLAGGFWLLRENLAGRMPEFLSGKKNIPLLFAALFSLLSALLSPVRALVMPEWWTFAAGVFILAEAGSLEAGGRRRTDLALRVSTWFIALLGLYQAFIFKSSDISASFSNPNALALFTLMLVPLAVMWKDFFLLGALLVVLVSTRSAAALLALLAAAGFYLHDDLKAAGREKYRPFMPALAAAAALLAVLAVVQLEPKSFLDRLGWWHAALRMFADRPLLGFGPGSFAYVYPAYHKAAAAGISTIYVHNYYLEFLAENGLLAFFFWGWAVARRLKETRGPIKYALIAVLAHSLADFGLAVPANFFIFCYLLGGAQPDCTPAAPASAKKTAAALAALGLACFCALGGVFLTQLKLERLHTEALASVFSGDYAAAEGRLEDAARLAPRNPMVPKLLGQIRMRAGFEKKDRPRLLRAAVALERTLLLNPYDAGVYRELGKLYAAAGEGQMAADLLKRKREVFRWEK